MEFELNLPCRAKLAEAEDGLLLATVHTYIPNTLPTIVRVCVYCAVSRSSNSLSSFSDSGGVSGPSDSGSRSSSGDTGESELRTWSTQVKEHSKSYI